MRTDYLETLVASLIRVLTCTRQKIVASLRIPMFEGSSGSKGILRGWKLLLAHILYATILIVWSKSCQRVNS
jgi:hypothetical protein